MIKQSSQDMATNGAAPDVKPSVVPTSKKTIPSKEKSTTKSGKAKDKYPSKDAPPVAPKAADRKRKHGIYKQTFYNVYNLVLLLNDVLLQLIVVAAKGTVRSTTTAGGYASSSSFDDTKPTVSTKYHGLDSVKTTASKRTKTNQLQLSATTQLENNDSSNLLANSSPVVLVSSRASRTTASLKRSRDSPTSNESQKQFFEGIAFPRTTTQESTSSSTAETTKLRAEIEELKKSVQALCASNKTLLESQAAKTQQKIIDSDSGRSHHRSTTARPREMPREIPKQATVEGSPAVEQSSIPKYATKGGAGEFSVSSSDEQSSVSSSPVSSRHTSRKQRRSCYMEISRY
jgi:hypothetical protein